jgi:hypothetical protein
MATPRLTDEESNLPEVATRKALWWIVNDLTKRFPDASGQVDRFSTKIHQYYRRELIAMGIKPWPEENKDGA